MHIFLLIVCLINGAISMVLNDLVDEMLDASKKMVLAQGRDTIHFPDVPLKEKRGVFQAECTGGWVRSLSTLRRTGDAVMTKTEKSVTVKLLLGLGNLELGFDRCKFHLAKIRIMDGKIAAKVSSNSVVAQATAGFCSRTGNCSMRLDDLRVTKLGKIEFTTGKGMISKIEDKVMTLFANLVKNRVVKLLFNELQEDIKKQLAVENLCCTIPLKLALKYLPA